MTLAELVELLQEVYEKQGATYVVTVTPGRQGPRIQGKKLTFEGTPPEYEEIINAFRDACTEVYDRLMAGPPQPSPPTKRPTIRRIK